MLRWRLWDRLAPLGLLDQWHQWDLHTPEAPLSLWDLYFPGGLDTPWDLSDPGSPSALSDRWGLPFHAPGRTRSSWNSRLLPQRDLFFEIS